MIDKVNSKRPAALVVLLGVLVALVGAGTALAAKPVDTTSTIGTGTGLTVAAGPAVTITGHVETSSEVPVTGGKIQIRELMLDGLGVPCDTEGAEYVSLNGGGDPPDIYGDVNVLFDTTGLGGSVIGFQSHYIPMGSGYAQSKSECVDLLLTDHQALPQGTTTYGQGYYGQAQQGELDTCAILEAMDSDPLAEMRVNAVSGITAILSLESFSIDVTTLDSVASLCSFLVEADEVNGNSDGGFLPAGKVDGKPVSNLAAQDITLRLNLNLDGVYGAWGDEGVEFRPLEIGYYLNIDPVPDPDGVMVYPLETTDGALGTCVDGDVPDFCEAGTATLTDLSLKIIDLDAAETTIGEILAAADSLLLSGEDDISVNRVTLTRGDLTEILSLINESYDEGIPTGFVTNGDPD